MGNIRKNKMSKCALMAASMAAALWGSGRQASLYADVTATYSGLASGSWNSAGNWAGTAGFVPTNGANGQNYLAVIDNNAGQNSAVTLNGNFTVDGLTINQGDLLTVTNNNELGIAGGGFLITDGTLQLAATNNPTGLVFGGGTASTVTFSGVGLISMVDNPNNRIYAFSAGMVLDNAAGHRIVGSGAIGFSGSAFTLNNKGTITGLGANALSVSPGAGLFNTGVMQAGDGTVAGLLNLSGDTFTNTGGQILATSTGTVTLFNGTSIVGGTLTSVGNGLIQVQISNTAALSNLTISAGTQLVSQNNSLTNLSGVITNNGSVTLAATNNPTEIRILSNTEIAGTGTIYMGNSVNNHILATDGISTLTLDAPATIQGAGNLGSGAMTLINNGVITANLSSGLILQPQATATASGFINNNILQASAGSTLFLHTGVFHNNGVILANDLSAVRLDSNVAIVGGTLTTAGSGQILASVSQFVNFTNVTVSAGSQVVLENNSTTRVTGVLTNNGTVTIQATNNPTDINLQGIVEFAGTGTFVMGNGNAAIDSTPGGTLTIDPGITIQGRGALSGIGIINHGLILGNNSSSPLSVNPGVAGLNNTGGIVRATAGASVFFTNGGVTNTGGTLTADAGSNVRIGNIPGVLIDGGILSSTGTGLISVIFNQITTLNNVTITAGTLFNAENNTYTNLSGTFTNNGSVTISATFNPTEIHLLSNTEIAGTGTIYMGNSGSNHILATDGISTLTLDATASIQGAGNIGSGAMTLINNGVITANLSSGLILQPQATATASGFINNNILQASAGSTLFLHTGVFHNNGVILANDLSVVRMDADVTILGGTLTTTGSGQIIATLNHFVNFTNVTISSGSQVFLENNSTTRVTGTLTNNGTVNFLATFNPTDINLQGAVEFAGTGTFVMGNSSAAIDSTPGGTLTIDPGITIQGMGALTGIAINNQGLIVGNNPSTALSILPTGVGLNNAGGTVRSTAGATISFSGGTVTNTGGTLTADATSFIRLGNNVTVVGGLLATTGSGQIHVTFNQPVNLTNVTISAGSQVFLENNSTTRVTGTLTNNGTVNFLATFNPTPIDLQGAVEFAGTGTFVMGNGNAQITSAPGGTLTIDPGITIQGMGALTGIGIINHGLILGNNPSTPLSILPTGSGLNNLGGTVRSTSGATISFSGGTVTNTSGTLTADTASFIRLGNNVTVTGGVLSTAGTGQIIVSAGQVVNLNNVTIVSGTQVLGENNTFTQMSGVITNNGTFTLAATNNATKIRFVGNTEFAGTGSFIMGNSSINSIVANNGVDTLTVDAGITIQGSGNIGEGAMALLNNGVITANQSVNLLLQPNAGGFTNNNLMQASNGATMILHGGAFQNNGVIAANDLSNVRLDSSAALSGGTLTTSGSGQVIVTAGQNVTLANLTISPGSQVLTENNTATTLSGTITNRGNITVAASFNTTILYIPGNVLLNGGGSVTMGNNSLNHIDGASGARLTSDNVIVGAGQIGVNQINITNKGVIEASTSVGITIDPISDLLNDTTGILRANGAGLSLTFGSYTNNGTVESVNGGNVTFATSAVITNIGAVGTTVTLTGGTWKAFANSGIVIQNLPDITTNAASVFLSGSGSNFLRFTNAINTNNGDFHLLAGRKFTTPSDFSNNGLLELGDPTGNAGGATLDFSAHTFTNNVSGTLTGFGTVNGRPLNHGTIIANGGTLTFSNGIQGGSGTLQANTGSVLDVSAGASSSSGDFLILQTGGSLTQGANDVLVKANYANANFGVGNLFNKHANVTASTGKILADGTNVQVITGDLGAGDQVNPLMAFGSIHVGDTKSFVYQIANIGAVPASGPSVLYAVQTSVNGGNITDPRLTGTGVTAQNLGPVALGGSSATQSVSFSGITAGSLSLQAIHVANNFDGNTAHATGPLSLFEQTVSFTGAAYRYADPIIGGSPVSFGNFHEGNVSASATYSLSNNAPNDGFSEKLDATVISTTGGIAISGNVSLLTPGATDNSFLTASFTGNVTAGHYTGSAQLKLVSDGAGTSELGLTTLGLSPATLIASADVFRLASPLVTNNDVTFPNAHVGDPVSQTISVANNVANDGFSERLNGTLTPVAGPNTFAHNFSLVLPGNSGSVTATLDTSTPGAKTGSAKLALSSDGTNTSNLPLTLLSTLTLTSSGNVYSYAAPGATSNINLGILHVGAAASAHPNVSNTAANDGFSEKLIANFASSTGAATVSPGSITIGPALSNNTGLTITLPTATAGIGITGTGTIHYQSDGSNSSNLGIFSLVGQDQTISITADILNFAQASLRKDSGSGTFVLGTNSATLDLGTVDAGNVILASLSALNIAVGPSDTLAGSWDLTAAGAEFGLSGFTSFTNVAGPSGAFSGLNVSFASNTPGLHTAQIVLHPLSQNDAPYSGPLTDFTLTINADVTEPIPEPATLGLVLGALPLLLRRRRKF